MKKWAGRATDDGEQATARNAMRRWQIGAAGTAIVILATWSFLQRPAVPAGQEDGVFANDCCGTLELRDGRMILNGKPATPYTVGRDVRGPYVLPQTYVGGYEQVGFEVDGSRPVARLRLDRLAHPTRIQLYGYGRAYIFARKDPPPRRQ